MFNNRIKLIAASLGLSLGSSIDRPEIDTPNDGFTRSSKGKSRGSSKPSGAAALKRSAKRRNNIRKHSKH